MKLSDLTANDGKITVLRGFDHDKFLVVQGDSWYGPHGLNENYQVFTDYGSALEYFDILRSKALAEIN